MCNRRKGTDLASIDPDTGRIERLFHPRQDRWEAHFRLEDGRIVPLTPEGRATVFLLRFDQTASVRLRASLERAGRLPG